MRGDAERSDLARAVDNGLKVVHRVRELDPDHPAAEDLHGQQIKAVARVIRRAAVLMIEREKAQDSG